MLPFSATSLNLALLVRFGALRLVVVYLVWEGKRILVVIARVFSQTNVRESE